MAGKTKIGNGVALGAIAVLVVCGWLYGKTGGSVSDAWKAATGSQVDRPTAARITAARTTLGKLPARTGGSMLRYNRQQFGSTWPDVDRNGCDTRSDILRRDLDAETPGSGCKVATGTLQDPYTGKAIDYTAAKPDTVQIDHVVALGAAWRQGAAAWTVQRRTQFANDPLNLLAVDGPTNQAKGDKTADLWGPRGEYRCAFSVRVIEVKGKYRLAVTPAEKNALTLMLGACGT